MTILTDVRIQCLDSLAAAQVSRALKIPLLQEPFDGTRWFLMKQSPVDPTDVCIFRIKHTGDDTPQGFEETHVLEIAWTFNDSSGVYDREVVGFENSDPLRIWDVRRDTHYYVR